MNQNAVWQSFSELPPEAQQQVIDFIAFLQTRYASARPAKGARRTELAQEAFIGMWRDRVDLQDSSAWVRSLREREWERKP